MIPTEGDYGAINPSDATQSQSFDAVVDPLSNNSVPNDVQPGALATQDAETGQVDRYIPLLISRLCSSNDSNLLDFSHS